MMYDKKRKLLYVNPAYGTYNVLVLKPWIILNINNWTRLVYWKSRIYTKIKYNLYYKI